MSLNEKISLLGLRRKHGCVAFARVVLLAGWLFASLPCCHAQVENPVVPDGTLTVSVVDGQGEPVAGAEVQIKTWGRRWEDTKFEGTTNEQGEVVFEAFESGYYPAALVAHPDFASTLQNFSFTDGQSSRVVCKLLKAEAGSLKIVSPDNKPIAGAMITRLTVSNAATGNQMVIGHSDFEMMTGRSNSAFVSDASGLLELPPLPVGSTVKAEILHPQWKSTKVAESGIKDLKSTTVVMARGTIVTAEFVGDDSVLGELEGEMIHVHLTTNSMTDEAKKYRIIHDFLVKNGAIEFCLASGQFSNFSLSVDGLQITPSFPGMLKQIEFTKIPETERITKRFVVQKPWTAKGRVVTEAGEPVPNATVMIHVPNMCVDEQQKLVPLSEFEYASSFAESDANGFYEAQIPEGPATLSVQWSGYYSKNDQLKSEFRRDQPLPDLVLTPLPVIAGKIVDPNGRPMTEAIARVVGSFGATKYVQADQDGRFEIKIENFEYDMETKKRLDVVKVLAFDPHGASANIVEVNLLDEAKYSNVVLGLVDHEPRWVVDEIEGILKRRSDAMMAQTGMTREKIGAMIEKNYPDGKPGIQAPEIATGTWFNTDFKSLKDFRGQYVLLDFWFIGCGPCERDFPSVQMAHDVFGDYGFSAISVHIAGQTPESVKQFCDAKGMGFPLVVESPNQEISKAYKSFGVSGYPSYLLLDPKGNVVSGVFGTSAGGEELGLGLHSDKLEVIRHFLLTAGQASQASPATQR